MEEQNLKTPHHVLLDRIDTTDRKAKFYERLHSCTANRRIIITPMIREDARRTADKLHLEVYSYAQDVKPFYSN